MLLKRRCLPFEGFLVEGALNLKIAKFEGITIWRHCSLKVPVEGGVSKANKLKVTFLKALYFEGTSIRRLYFLEALPKEGSTKVESIWAA